MVRASAWNVNTQKGMLFVFWKIPLAVAALLGQ